MSDSSSQVSNSRLGIRLFFFYSVFYFGFVLVNAFAAPWSEYIVFAGLNLAIVWGFSLIGLAFVLAIIYGVSCKTELVQASPNKGGDVKGDHNDGGQP